jgi:hypothetical protein
VEQEGEIRRAHAGGRRIRAGGGGEADRDGGATSGSRIIMCAHRAGVKNFVWVVDSRSEIKLPREHGRGGPQPYS